MENLFKDYLADCVAVTVFLGSNDASVQDACPELHVPLLEYQQNLTDICRFLQVWCMICRSIRGSGDGVVGKK